MSSAVVFGGYGVFGALVARELARLGLSVVIAGRDSDKAEALACELGPAHRGIAADLTNPDSCRAVLRGKQVAVNCAGPFSTLGPVLLEACLGAGCHYADIADNRRYTSLVRSYDQRFRQRNLTAAYGCSSVPGISGALGLAARVNAFPTPRKARVTLFVGNDNAKGGAAIRSVIELLGKPIQTPQGIIRGFRDREVVPLPEPFGRRAVFNFDSADYDLLPDLLGVRSVSVKLGLEMKSATYALAFLAVISSGYGRRTATLFERLGKSARGYGCSGGAVMTELFYADGSARRACLFAKENGQRLAALPCALAAQASCDGATKVPGAVTVYELLGASALLERLVAEGYELECSDA